MATLPAVVLCVGCSVPAQRDYITTLTLSCTAARVQAYALPAGFSDTLLYFQRGSIFFQGAQVRNIHAGSMGNIIAFNSCTQLNLTNFVSSGCQAQSQIVSVTNSSKLYVVNSIFRDTSARGLSITNSNAELDGNVYDNLGHFSSSIGGGAPLIDNSGDRWVSVTQSNFSNNIAVNQRGGPRGNLHDRLDLLL